MSFAQGDMPCELMSHKAGSPSGDLGTWGQHYHDGLSPKDSARAIIAHVADGVEIARENNLPEVIRDFIEVLDIMQQHPGSTAESLLGGGEGFTFAPTALEDQETVEDEYAEFTV